MLGIPWIAWGALTAGYYGRELIAPSGGAARGAPDMRPPYPQQPYPQPPPQFQPQPYPQQPQFQPPAFRQQAPPPQQWQAPPQPPARRHTPVALDAHIDEQTDYAVSRALQDSDVAQVRGFAQSIEGYFPVAAGVLRMHAFGLERARAAQAPPAAQQPPFHVPPAYAQPGGGPPPAQGPAQQPPKTEIEFIAAQKEAAARALRDDMAAAARGQPLPAQVPGGPMPANGMPAQGPVAMVTAAPVTHPQT
jgi:hypothetical protein